MVRVQTALLVPLTTLLDRCKSMRELKQMHAVIHTTGLSSDTFFISKLLLFTAVSDSGDIDYSHKLFKTIINPNTFFWNTIIRGFSKSKKSNMSASFYIQMLRSEITPNYLTYPFLAKSCARLQALSLGMSVHCHCVKYGLDLDKFVQNSLIHMYASCNDIEVARLLFDEMLQRNMVSWNAMIDAYAKCGDVHAARELFDIMTERDVVSWSALIDGYVKAREYREAVTLFERMLYEGPKANSVTMVSVLCACSHLGALNQGRKMHSYIKDNGLDTSLELCTSLVDMYAKCGSIDEALEIFRLVPMSNTDVLIWNAVIGGLAMHGLSKESLEMYREMQIIGVKPDEITYLALLSACAHGGLIDNAWLFFRELESSGLVPKIEHYACMVDALGKSGRVEEAYEFVENMPVEPSTSVLGALLSACQAHGFVELAETVGTKLIQMEPDHDGRYIGLSNCYAVARRWNDVKVMRETMESRGVKKVPGNSALEIDGHCHRFIAHDKTHPRSCDVYVVLNVITKEMRKEHDNDIQEVLLRFRDCW